MLQKYNYIKSIFTSIIIISILASCAKEKKDESKPVIPEKPWEPNVEQRVRDYQGGLLSTGKGGFSIGGKSDGGGNIKFANTNVLWKASISALEEIPLLQVDYAGGIIITDWYGKSESDGKSEEIKITIKFLSDELSASSFEVISHKKNCINYKCTTEMGGKSLNDTVKEKIVTSARALSIEEKKAKDKK